MGALFLAGFGLATVAAIYFVVRAVDRYRYRRVVLARLARIGQRKKISGWHGWPDEAGYYPGSLTDPRD